jgi:NSS family neurotransmitter:Na+ symporter
MIFPAAFSFGLDVNSGAGLAFITLPNIFSQLPYGNVFAVLFFTLLFFAAFTSSISIVEVPTAALIENFKLSRSKAAAVVSVVVFVLAIPVTLSMGIMGNIKFFGLNLFDFFDYITSNILLPLNTIILCIVIGWFVKLRNIRAFHNKTVYAIFNFLLRFVTPAALTILILFGTILKR